MPHYKNVDETPPGEAPTGEELDDAVDAAAARIEALGVELRSLAAEPAALAGDDQQDRAAAVVDELATELRALDEPEPEPERAATAIERATNLLELNGYNAVRHEARAALSTLAAIPPEALDAALEFAHRTRDRFKSSPDARAHKALEGAELDVTILSVARRTVRELERLGERKAARDRILAP